MAAGSRGLGDDSPVPPILLLVVGVCWGVMVGVVLGVAWGAAGAGVTGWVLGVCVGAAVLAAVAEPSLAKTPVVTGMLTLGAPKTRTLMGLQSLPLVN